MPNDHHLTEDDLEPILSRALRREGTSESSIRDRLLAAAQELDLSEDAILAAEEEWRQEKAELQERREFQEHARKDFMSHFTSYLLVNAFLVFLDLRSDMVLNWAYWPIAGWGLGLLFHAASAFFRGTSMYEESFRDWKKQQDRKRKRHARRQAREN